MQKAAEGTIPDGEVFGTRLSSAGYNLYQFQWAHCFNEIVCKHAENEEKLEKIKNTTFMIGNERVQEDDNLSSTRKREKKAQGEKKTRHGT